MAPRSLGAARKINRKLACFSPERDEFLWQENLL